MIDKIKRALGGLRGKTIGALGLSFKPNTDDLRDSPAIGIIEALIKKGVSVQAYDPVAMDGAKKKFKKIIFRENPYEAARGADGILLLTEWNEFRNLDFNRLKELLNQPIMIDLRNVYNPETIRDFGFSYISVGRK